MRSLLHRARAAALAILAGTAAFTPAVAQDPLLTLRSTNEVQEGHFGLSVAGGGDLDADGLADLVVGAPEEAVGTAEEAGRAYVFSGADGDLHDPLVSPDPQDSGRFGSSVDLIGDVDGDGAADVVVGAPNEDVGTLAAAAGRAYVFSGFSGALLHTLVSPIPEDFGGFGSAVAGVGDVDGDGVTDILVGAPFEDQGASPDDAGRVHLFSGATGTLLYSRLSFGEALGGNFGWSVAGAGDLDGDGVPDFLVGAPGERTSRGRVYVFSGALGTISGRISSPNAEPGGDFGVSVAGVGDASGDGVPDIAVGAEGEDFAGFSESGRAYLFSGADGALLHTLVSPTPIDLGALGVSVAPAGDQNGDGFADVLAGAYSEEGAGLDESGQAHVFSGADGSVLFTLVSPTPSRFGFFGVDVGFAGDTNGDGEPDLVVGASRETPDGSGSPVGAGRAHVFGEAAAVAVSAEPVNPPILISPGGGSFQFTVTLTNGTGQSLTVQAWTAVTGPVNREPVMGPLSVMLPAGGSVTRTLTQQVPAAAPAGTYTYIVNAGTFPGGAIASDSFAFTKLPAQEGAPAAQADAWAVSEWDEAVEASATLPDGFALGEVSPNPFSSLARLALAVAEAQAVRVEVFDGLGRRVAVLHDGEIEAGTHALVLDGASLPVGVYVVRATGETFSAARRVTLVR
jgi:hypothetical protein